MNRQKKLRKTAVIAGLISLFASGGLISIGIEKARADKPTDSAGNKASVIWIGHPMVSDDDWYEPSQGWIRDVQIGLRSDGVVVWRDVKETSSGR